MDEGVRQLRAAIEESEKLAEDVLLIKQRLIDNDRERNKAREAMAALRRVQREREQQERQRQESLGPRAPQRVPASMPSPGASRAGPSSLAEPQRTHTPGTAASRGGPGPGSGDQSRVLLEPTAALRTRTGDAGPPSSLLLGLSEARASLSGRAGAALPKDSRPQSRSGPLIEELPSPGLELRGPRGGSSSEAADVAPCSLCGRRGPGGGSSPAAGVYGSESSLAAPEARRQQVWMAFPVSGPADGSRAPGVFFLAPQAAVQEQLKRDLAAMDSQADELRELQKVSLQQLSDKGGLDAAGGGLVKALTSLKDRPS